MTGPDITFMTRSANFYVLFILAMTVWLWGAWLIWENDSLAQQIIIGGQTIDSLQALESIPPLLTAPLRQVLLLNSRKVDTDNMLMTAVARKYQHRRPLDPQGWLWASEFYQRNDENEMAAENLVTAHLLSRTNSPLLMKVFNRYLALGLNKQAMPVARDLVFADPGKFRKIFYLLTRLNADYATVVREVIPNSVPTHRTFEADIYYSWALTDAVRAENQGLAKAVWAAVPSELKLNADFGLSYLKFLVSLQNRQEASAVWQDLTGSPLSVNQITQSGFETPLNDVSPCWESRKSSGASAALDDNAFEGQYSLMVEFNGEENINYSHLSCLVLVEPGKSYRMTGMWSGKGISTLSGPFIDVYAPGIKRFYKRSESMLGTWPWRGLELDFTVPADAEIIALRIRRQKTDLLDSKISGRVWFDSLKLLALEPETNHQSLEQAVMPKVYK